MSHHYRPADHVFPHIPKANLSLVWSSWEISFSPSNGLVESERSRTVHMKTILASSFDKDDSRVLRVHVSGVPIESENEYKFPFHRTPAMQHFELSCNLRVHEATHSDLLSWYNMKTYVHSILHYDEHMDLVSFQNISF